MAYTVAQFITQAESGGAVKISKPSGNNQVLFKIGGTSITITEAQNNLDLGLQFSAAQVLDSVPLSRAIDVGMVIAEAGTTALSKTPTV